MIWSDHQVHLKKRRMQLIKHNIKTSNLEFLQQNTPTVDQPGAGYLHVSWGFMSTWGDGVDGLLFKLLLWVIVRLMDILLPSRIILLNQKLCHLLGVMGSLCQLFTVYHACASSAPIYSCPCCPHFVLLASWTWNVNSRYESLSIGFALTVESTTHQPEMRMPKMEVTRLSDPMSMVPVFNELQPQQLNKPMICKCQKIKKRMGTRVGP